MTSRLYQTVREKKGLAYSVYSQLLTFMDTGMMTIYAGTDAKNVRNTIELILAEILVIRLPLLLLWTNVAERLL